MNTILSVLKWLSALNHAQLACLTVIFIGGSGICAYVVLGSWIERTLGEMEEDEQEGDK
jgi:hypothetical protein